MLLSMSSAQQFLAQEYSRRRQVNPRYSQRAFARQIGLSPGELSEVLSGKRGLSLKSALRISKAMGLTATETKHLIHLAQLQKTRTMGASDLLEPSSQPLESLQLSQDAFFVVSAWYCFAILNLVDCEGFRWDPQWIARRLGITKTEVQSAIDRMERVGVIQSTQGQRPEQRKVAKDYISLLGGVPSESVRDYHRQMLEMAKQALEFQALEERDISGVGFAVDPRFLPSIKKDIQDFQDQLVAKYARGKKRQVYQLEMALFRLTKGEANDN